MGAFMVLAVLVLLAVLFCLIYVSMRTARFPFVLRMTGGRKRVAVLISFAAYLAICILLYLTINAVNMVIVIVHFGGFWLLSELVFLIIRKARGHAQAAAAHNGAASHSGIESTVNNGSASASGIAAAVHGGSASASGIAAAVHGGSASASGMAYALNTWLPGTCAIIFTIIYMTVAWYLCTHVWEKDYSFESDRLKGDLRIVQITDSHVGATFHAQRFHDYVLEINALRPDVVVVTGDFVDDDTSREDMIGSCEALGDLETTYGVYFSYGNHDKGYFSDEAKGWNNQDLCENLEKNGVTILQDESVLLDDRFYLIGRQDKSEEMRGGSRKTPQQLTESLDPDLYKIVMDHQPLEYDDEAEAGADLVLSGHTHGGQFFPFNQIGVLTRSYERSYGHERRGHTDFIVSSGIADWALIFKTGCKSEYVVVDIHGV